MTGSPVRPILRPPTLSDPVAGGADADLHKELQERYAAYNESFKKLRARQRERYEAARMAADPEARRKLEDDKRADEERRKLEDEEKRAAEVRRKLEDDEKRAAEVRRKLEDEVRATEARRKLDEERRAEEERRKLEEEKHEKRKEAAKRGAETKRREAEKRKEAARRGQETKRRKEAERLSALSSEAQDPAVQPRDEAGLTRADRARREARRLLDAARARKGQPDAHPIEEAIDEGAGDPQEVAFADARRAEEAAAKKGHRSALANRKAKLLFERAEAIAAADRADQDLDRRAAAAEAADYSAMRDAEAVVKAKETLNVAQAMRDNAFEELKDLSAMTAEEIESVRERHKWYERESSQAMDALINAERDAILSHDAAYEAAEAHRNAGRLSRRAQERLVYVQNALQLLPLQEEGSGRTDDEDVSQASTTTAASTATTASTAATASTTSAAASTRTRSRAKKKLSFSVPSPTPEVAMNIVRRKMIAAGKQLFGPQGAKLMDEYMKSSKGLRTKGAGRKGITRAQLQAVLHNVRDHLQQQHAADSGRELEALEEFERQQEQRDRAAAARISDAMSRVRAPGGHITEEEAQRIATAAKVGNLLALDAEMKRRLSKLMSGDDEHPTPSKSRRTEPAAGTLQYSVGKI